MRLPARRIVLLFSMALLFCSMAQVRFGWAQAPSKKLPTEDWAEDLLKDDPLTGKEEITLADLQQALRDPKRRDSVVQRHFSRAKINVNEQKEFLQEALLTDSEEVQHQTLDQLQELDLLQEVVAEFLLKEAEKGDEAQQRAAVLALQDFEWRGLEIPNWYQELVKQTMTSEDSQLREAAIKQYLSWGPEAIPSFLQQFRSQDPKQQQQAAYALSRLLAKRRALPGTAAPKAAAPPGPAIAKAQAVTASGPQSGREIESQKSRLVRVFFGTNRALIANHKDPRYGFAWGMLWALFGLAIPYFRIRYRQVPKEPLPRRRTAWFTFWCFLIGLGIGGWGIMSANESWYLVRSHRVGPEFAGSRSANHQVYYGYCDVSIPPSHQVGLVEQPLLGAEDEAKHVVIQHSTLLQDQDFFETVRRSIAACPRQDTFVFIHGYNVSFDQAARRTAQIHYDLEFEGIPLFYSWPSRSNMRLYASDRNEIGYSVEHIKQFLIDVKQRAKPGRIHVVAHSMGAEGAARAIAALGDEGKIFDQIILAAPDIDADVFREQLAPRLAQYSQRTTLYCSRNDWALHASYAFNDGPRAGDSSYGVMVREDMDTIDASEIDTDLLGHSYYGDCLPILRDVRLMIERNLRPEDRELERAEVPGNLIYWLFHHPPG